MSTPLLLLVLFDGLGHQLFQDHYQNFGNISKFYLNSPKVNQGVTPVFPSITVSNLMSISTGLYVENHGISGNKMFANQNELHKYNNTMFNLFTDSDEEGAWWDNGLNMPIWTLNELSATEDNPRFSGSMFWSGAGAPYRGHNIRHHHAYNPNISWFEEVNTVMEWFTNKDRPTNCVFLYFDNPDLVLHKYGSQSQQFLESLKKVDEVLGYLSTKIEENNLQDKLNIIVTADHGHFNVPVNNYNEIGRLNISVDYIKAITNTIIWSVTPPPEDGGLLFDKLHRGSLTMNYSVWRKNEFPENAHYRNAPHVGSIIVLSDLGYRTVFVRFGNVSLGGSHGYNNTYPEMKAFFMAQGPAFNSSAEIDSFNNVDLYPLMCLLLDISPSSNNGSLHRVSSILNDSYKINRPSDSNMIATGVGVFLIVFAVLALTLFVYRMYKQYWNRRRPVHKYGLVEGGNPFLSDSDDDDDNF